MIEEKNANTGKDPLLGLKGAAEFMKCTYCGRQFSGEGAYCSERCRKHGEAAGRLAAKTRIPFWIATAVAGAVLLLGVVFLIAESVNQAFLMFGGAVALEGLTLVVLPRGRRGGSTISQILGGVLFTLGVICVILWR